MSDIKIQGSSLKVGLLPVFAFIVLVGLFYLVSAVIGSYTVQSATGGGNNTTIFVLEDTALAYNITVNVTDGFANVTVVNITLPTGFTFAANSNGTGNLSIAQGGGVLYGNLFNTTGNGILSWINNSVNPVIGNLSQQAFYFNATAAQPGTYNLSVLLVNASGGPGNVSRAITVVVNDTTPPDSIVFGGDTDVAGGNLSRANMFIRINFSDNGAFRSATIEIFNSTANYTLVNQSVTTTNGSSYAVNFTGLADGRYYINATVNDTFNNVNSTTNLTANYNISIDTTAPTISFSCTPNPVDQDDQITCTCTATDANSGVKSTSSTLHPSTSNTGTQSTSCTAIDHAGNQRVLAYEYTVNGVGSGSSSGSSGGSGSSTTTWTNTIVLDAEDLQETGELTKELAAASRMRIKLAGETHHVGVVSLTATSAEIEIASDPQKATLNVGETKKFEVNGDTFYDMKVTLESIESDKASLKVEYVHEEIPQEVAESETQTDEQVAAGEGATEGVEGSSSKTIWIVIAVIVVIVVVGLVWMKRRK